MTSIYTIWINKVNGTEIQYFNDQKKNHKWAHTYCRVLVIIYLSVKTLAKIQFFISQIKKHNNATTTK